jgi:hypothetical protein
MCRILSYMGTPVLLDHLLYAPDSSLLNQTTAAQMLSMLNLHSLLQLVYVILLLFLNLKL